MTRLVTFGETPLRISPPDHQQLATATDARIRVDGTESNVALAADRLGTPAVWLSKLPDTPLGRRVVAELHQHGLDTDVAWGQPAAGRQTLTFHEDAASPRSDVVVQDRGDAAFATATPGELAMTLVQQAEAVFVGGSTVGLSQRARETVSAVLHAAEGETVLAVDYEPGLWSPEAARERLTSLFDAIDTLVATEDEVRTVFGASGEPRDLLHEAVDRGDFARVVLATADGGAVAWQDNVLHEQSSFDVESVDDAGKDDAFVGGFLAALVHGASMDEALASAAAAGALARTIHGPLPLVERDDLDRLLAAGTGDTAH